MGSKGDVVLKSLIYRLEKPLVLLAAQNLENFRKYLRFGNLFTSQIEKSHLHPQQIGKSRKKT